MRPSWSRCGVRAAFRTVLSTAAIDKLLPAGSVDLEMMPERRDFDEGAAGDAAWAEAVDGATEGFALCSRQASTAKEHVSYMVE